MARASESRRSEEECVAFEGRSGETNRIASALSRKFHRRRASVLFTSLASFTATEAYIFHAARNEKGRTRVARSQVAHDLQYFNPGRDRGKLGEFVLVVDAAIWRLKAYTGRV